MKFPKSTHIRFIGLSLAAPLKDASELIEPNGGGYTRVAFNRDADWKISYIDNNNGEVIVSNVNEIVLPKATSDWGVVTHFVIFDAIIGENMLAYGKLLNPIKIYSGDTVSFAAGDLELVFEPGE